MEYYKKRVYKMRVLRLVSFLLVFFFALYGLGFMCRSHDDFAKATVSSFYHEPRETLDYVVVGSSAAQCGIYPAIIYKNTGITGNDLCIDGADSKIYLSMLEEALKTQPGALIIVDLDGFTEYTEVQEYNASSIWLDSMKPGINHIRTIERADRENRLEHYFPILKYHRNLIVNVSTIENAKFSLWCMIGKSTTPLKGGRYLNYPRLSEQLMRLLRPCTIEDPTPASLNPISEEYLIEFIDFCEERGVRDILFVDMPKAYANEERRKLVDSIEKKSESCRRIVEKRGYNVINFNTADNPLGLTKYDFADTLHLNNVGALKSSAFMSDYLASHYTFGEKSADVVEAWDASVAEAYEQYTLE